MFIPGKERYTEMTPEEFERFSLRFLQAQADKIDDAVFDHDVMIKSHDGTYQIDGTIRFSYLGLSFLCLVECKRYKGPIEREKVAALYAKMQSLGAQKGIIVATSYFQKGALLFAAQHGIALITITDEGVTYHRRSDDMPDIHLPVNGSMYVPVFTEAISENTFADHFMYNQSSNAIKEFLLMTQEV